MLVDRLSPRWNFYTRLHWTGDGLRSRPNRVFREGLPGAHDVRVLWTADGISLAWLELEHDADFAERLSLQRLDSSGASSTAGPGAQLAAVRPERRSSGRRAAASLAVLACMAGSAGVARAETADLVDPAGVALLAAVALPPAVGALVTGIGNWVDLGDPAGPNRRWVLAGYVCGGVATALAGVLLAVAFADAAAEEPDLLASGLNALPWVLPALGLGVFALTTTFLNVLWPRSPALRDAASPWVRAGTARPAGVQGAR